MNISVKVQKMENMPGALTCWEGSTCLAYASFLLRC